MQLFPLVIVLIRGVLRNSDSGRLPYWKTFYSWLCVRQRTFENGTFLNHEYFDHLLAEIREIRASERRFYQKIADIYSTAIDYNPDTEITQTFFATVQNKLHFAIHRHTAAEVIMKRANSEKDNMGLNTWKNSPKGKILKTDVSIAKIIWQRKN